MSLAPTPRLIRQQVAAVRDKKRGARVVGIRAAPSANLPETLAVGDETFDVVATRSSLEIRERLVAENSPPLILVTDLDDAELGADLLARLAGGERYTIEPWQLVQDRFKAYRVDPAVYTQPWIAMALLEHEPDAGYPPAPGGFLAMGDVRKVLLGALLGLPEGECDSRTLIAWALDDSARQYIAALPDPYRDGLLDMVADGGGPLSKLLLAFVIRDPTVDSNPLTTGLAMDALLKSEEAEVGSAFGFLEGSELQGLPWHRDLAKPWAEASASVLRQLIEAGAAARVQDLMYRAEAVLNRANGASALIASDLLTGSFTARLRRFADGARRFAEGRATRLPATLREHYASIEAHELASGEGEQRRQCERAAAALRLTTWVARQRAEKAPNEARFADIANRLRLHLGFVDWARRVLWHDSGHQEVTTAYRALLEAAAKLRERENEAFGQGLAQWSSNPTRQDLVPVEHFITETIKPLAEQMPVCLIVMDGMDLSVFRELELDLARSRWQPIDHDVHSPRRAVIAALPSVTEVSRASLLGGQLMVGSQGHERHQFEGHEELVGIGSRNHPPRLFFKSDVMASGDDERGNADFIATIEGTQRRIVAVVINAVDDNLAKGQQLNLEWKVSTVRPLAEILRAAESAGRAVVFVSDHGHVLDFGQMTYQQSSDAAGGERWRGGSAAAGNSDVAISGPRVLLPTSGGPTVLPWSERVRFAKGKHGYHGGASPQEVLIPCGVYTAKSEPPAGWREVGFESVEWWSLDVADTHASSPEPAPKAKKPANKAQTSLFGDDSNVPGVVATPAWMDALIASELMIQQRQTLGARARLTDDRLRAVLSSIDAQGGQTTLYGLATQLDLSPNRLEGVLAALRRILNVDGYDVLAVDAQANMIRLDVVLLRTQFGLGG